jgi:hypothetical protein
LPTHPQATPRFRAPLPASKQEQYAPRKGSPPTRKRRDPAVR